MDPMQLTILLKAMDGVLTGIFSFIKAIQTDDAEVQAELDKIIDKLKALPNFKPPGP